MEIVERYLMKQAIRGDALGRSSEGTTAYYSMTRDELMEMVKKNFTSNRIATPFYPAPISLHSNASSGYSVAADWEVMRDRSMMAFEMESVSVLPIRGDV